jgi:hypothetical protein
MLGQGEEMEQKCGHIPEGGRSVKVACARKGQGAPKVKPVQPAKPGPSVKIIQNEVHY